MINEERYTITLSRLEICDLMLACTGIQWKAAREMKEDPNCPEFRRDHVLPKTVEKWGKLHDKLERQLDELDAALIFSQLLDDRENGKISKDDIEKEMAYKIGFLLR